MSRLWVNCLAFLSLAVPAVAQSKPDRTAMYEDVEVMRRLLGDAIAKARPQPMPSTYQWQYPNLGTNLNQHPYLVQQQQLQFNNARFNQPGARYVDPRGLQDYPLTLSPFGGLTYDNNVFQPTYWTTAYLAEKRPAPPPTDGTYIKGVGVLLDVTIDYSEAKALKGPVKSPALAAQCARCHGTAMDQKIQATPAAPKKEAADPWDAQLRQVRGEKVPEAAPAPATRLGSEEVCVPGKLSDLVVSTVTTYGHRFRELAGGERIVVIVTLKGAPKPASAEPAANDPAAHVKSLAEEHLALADLHAKQGKTDDAVKAYQKVVDMLSKPLRFADTTPHEQAAKLTDEATKTLRAAHGKLAQNLLVAGKLDEAKSAIESAKTATVRLEGAAKPPAAAKPPLPIKLTVSLGKNAIDEHRAGKINQHELRSAADVEAVGFPQKEKKSGKP
jgi:cytochrome c553